MPYTLNGFGTMYYGRREEYRDGSYITTLWITALYVPVGAAGILSGTAGKARNWIGSFRQQFLVSRVPLCLRQVVNVYLLSGPLIAAYCATRFCIGR